MVTAVRGKDVTLSISSSKDVLLKQDNVVFLGAVSIINTKLEEN